MRVISGSARRLPLKTIEGPGTRPTTDRIKETLFNMIADWIPGCVFLDLFAGSGQIGIEALSRGASEAVFVEKNPKAALCIEENLKFTKLSDKGNLMKTDAVSALRRLEGRRKFDYIFMDPPYEMDLERGVLEYLASSDLLNEGAVIIIEARLQDEFPYIEELGYSTIKVKKYKTNKHIFIEREEK